MILPLSAPSRRIVVALAVSLLLHAWILTGARIRLPELEPTLPLLQARIEPLPSAPEIPQPQKKPQPHPRVKPEIAQQAATTPSEIPPAEPLPMALPVAVIPGERPQLPRRAQLTFAVTTGTSSLVVGELIHQLEVLDGHYELQATSQSAGMASLFQRVELTQTSSGNYARETGLQPQQFVQERTGLGDTHRTVVSFDHEELIASFSHGLDQDLPPDLQDLLSVLYQFPPLENTEIVYANISSGEKIETMQFEIANDETITTPFGKLLTVHLKKMHPANEAGWEIWLAREYRLFPVKMRIIEANGEIASETTITDIRVEDAPQEN